MDLDLQQDAADVYAYIVSRVAAYTPEGDRGPGGAGPVKMVYAGYEAALEGWFALVFDRRPEARHDGEWTMYIEGNVLDRPRWVTARGKLGPVLGPMLVGVLQQAEREGVFARLPRAEGFRLGLEEFHGSWGWDSQAGKGGRPEEHEADAGAAERPGG